MATEFKIRMELINQQLENLKIDGEKPTTGEGIRIYEALEAELTKTKNDFCNLALQGGQVNMPTAATTPSPMQDYTAIMRLQNAFQNIPQFSGINAEHTSRWISQLQMINSTIKVDFETFRGSMMQRIHIQVFKSLSQYEETTTIENFEQLIKFFSSTYGQKLSIPQRLETVWTQPKERSMTWPNWASSLEGKMSALETSLREQRRSETKDSDYELKSSDVFQLFSKLKFLTELKVESNELYRVITAESNTLKNVSQMSHRAELLKTQSITSSASSYSATSQNSINPNNRHKSNSNKSRSNYRGTGTYRGTGSSANRTTNNGSNNRGYPARGNGRGGYINRGNSNRGYRSSNNSSNNGSSSNTYNRNSNHGTNGNRSNGNGYNLRNRDSNNGKNHGNAHLAHTETPEENSNTANNENETYYACPDESFNCDLN